MDTSGRYFRTQASELSVVPRPRHRLIVVLLATAVVVPALVAGVISSGPPVPVSMPESKVAAEAWLTIVREAEGQVPAALLLGATGSHPHLDDVLAQAGVSPDAFRRTAKNLLQQTGPEYSDSDLRLAWANAIDGVTLPEGVTPPWCRPGSETGSAGGPSGEIAEQVRGLLHALPGDARQRSIR